MQTLTIQGITEVGGPALSLQAVALAVALLLMPAPKGHAAFGVWGAVPVMLCSVKCSEGGRFAVHRSPSPKPPLRRPATRSELCSCPEP